MAKADFYILETPSGMPSLQYVCRLVERYYQENKKIFIHTSSKADAERIDKLLWTFKEDSFLPHDVCDEWREDAPSIQIGYGIQTLFPPAEMILINLNPEIPAFYTQFNHIIEIVFSDPTVQQLARERFKTYRASGLEMNTYKIKTSDL